MKNTLSLLLASFIFINTPLVYAQEIPFGVSSKEIELSGTIYPTENLVLGYYKGKLLDSYEYKVGARTGVQVESISYSLHFWNVGALGGTSGYLFWKKDFGRATLSISYNIGNPGQIITGTTEIGEQKMQSYQMEPAESDPDIEPITCGLRFTGGPKGTFKGTCGNGATIEGRVSGSGAFVVFEKITQPEKQEDVERGLSMIGFQELALNGEFSDWKFDESTLEDVGARFSSLSGEVETRHDNDTEWHFAKLDTIPYLLDHVKTGEESQAIIGFADLSTFLLKESSEIIITTPPKKDSKIGLVMGTIKANVKKLVQDGTMEVETSQAVAGIKGTRFILTATPEETVLEVTEGSIAFRSKVDNTEVMVQSGESVRATATGLSEKTIFDAESADTTLIEETSQAQTPNTQNTEGDSAHQNSYDTSPFVWISLLIFIILIVITVGLIRRSQKQKNIPE